MSNNRKFYTDEQWKEVRSRYNDDEWNEMLVTPSFIELSGQRFIKTSRGLIPEKFAEEHTIRYREAVEAAQAKPTVFTEPVYADGMAHPHSTPQSSNMLPSLKTGLSGLLETVMSMFGFGGTDQPITTSLTRLAFAGPFTTQASAPLEMSKLPPAVQNIIEKAKTDIAAAFDDFSPADEALPTSLSRGRSMT